MQQSNRRTIFPKTYLSNQKNILSVTILRIKVRFASNSTENKTTKFPIANHSSGEITSRFDSCYSNEIVSWFAITSNSSGQIKRFNLFQIDRHFSDQNTSRFTSYYSSQITSGSGSYYSGQITSEFGSYYSGQITSGFGSYYSGQITSEFGSYYSGQINSGFRSYYSGQITSGFTIDGHFEEIEGKFVNFSITDSTGKIKGQFKGRAI
jgi:hypothetical protein